MTRWLRRAAPLLPLGTSILGTSILVTSILVTSSGAATLRPETRLAASVVRLGDLFDGAPAAERVLGSAPPPGKSVVVESAQLAAIARQFGVAWTPASTADRAVLDRPGRPVPREPVLAALREALAAAGAAPDCDVDLTGYAAPMVPTDAAQEVAVTDLDWNPDGRFTALLSVTAPEMEPANLRLAGRAIPMDDIAVPVRALAPGEVIGPADLRVAHVRALLAGGEVVRDPTRAIGLAPRHRLIPGQAVALASLYRPAVIERHDIVVLILDVPGLALTARGEALDPGAVGERIRVLNTVSRAVLDAEVIGPGNARVTPGTVPITPPGHGPAAVNRYAAGN